MADEWNPDEATDASDGKPDTAVVPLVEELNRRGVATLQSCSGHNHASGTRTDGHLWLGPDALDEESARSLTENDAITAVCRRYAREDCWEVGFPGLADGVSALEDAAEAIIEATSGSCPACGGGDAVEMLELPGGREVRYEDVPFSNAVRGAEAFSECRDCGHRLTGADG